MVMQGRDIIADFCETGLNMCAFALLPGQIDLFMVGSVRSLDSNGGCDKAVANLWHRGGL